MLVPRTLSVATTSAAMGKQHTLGITLSDSSGPHGLASSSPQFYIASLVALARRVVVEGGNFLAVGEVRAQGAEDPSSMVIERSTREHNVTSQPLKELPRTRPKPARMGKFKGFSFRARSDHALEANKIAHCCEYDRPMSKA